MQEGIVLGCGANMANSCRKVYFCDVELVWRTVAGRYCFVMWRQCGELLQESIVFDAVPVWATLAGRYCFMIHSQCGELLQKVIVL